MPRKSNVAERWGVVIIFLIAIGGIAQAWSSERINEIVLEETGITCVDGDILEYNGTYWKCANNTAIITGNASGSGPYHPHDQGLNTTNAVTFTTINTGQGANELYDMNQDVLTTTRVDFRDIEIGKGYYLGRDASGNPSFETYLKLENPSRKIGRLYFFGSNEAYMPPIQGDGLAQQYIEFDTQAGHINFQDQTGTYSLVTLADDNPEPSDVHWSDLTDQGTFTDSSYCTYNSTSGYINCNATGGEYVHIHDQDLNTTNNVAFKNLTTNNLFIYEEAESIHFNLTEPDKNIVFWTTDEAGGSNYTMDLFKISADTRQVMIAPTNQLSAGVQGVLNLGGNITTSIVGSSFGINPKVYGSTWAAVIAEPTMMVGNKAQVFRFQPKFAPGTNKYSEMLFFDVPTPANDITEKHQGFYMVENPSLNAFAADNMGNYTTEGIQLGGIVSAGDLGYRVGDYTWNQIILNGGLNRFIGTGGTLRNIGINFSNFGQCTNCAPHDVQYATWSDGGEFHYENSVMNQTKGGYSLWNTPHGEAYNVTPNGYTLTIGSLNTWVNITGLLTGELEEFTFDNGLIPNHDGRYKLDWSLSFGGSGGSTHKTGVLVNNIEHEPCTSFRKLGTAGDVGNMGGTCILTAVGGDNITLAVQDILAPAQNIDVWSVNYNLEYVGET